MEEFVTSFEQIVFILTVVPLEAVLVELCPHSIPDQAEVMEHSASRVSLRRRID